MDTRTLSSRGASGFAILALALLLAACVKSKPASTPLYKISGAISGMSGIGLVLQNNGGDNLARSANGAFTFSREMQKDAAYKVTVFVQPASQTCTVANGSGTVKADVTNVAVTCTGGTFTVGGTVSGLTGTGLVLQDNGTNDLPVSADGGFTFSTPIASGGSYNVTVLTQPSGQKCTVSNGTGTVSASVTNVAVACVNTTFTVGGMVSGLTGTGLVLQNNGGNDLPVANDGAFAFSTALANGATYGVTVLAQPSGQGCSVANGSGTITGADIINVAVSCVAPPAPPTASLAFGVKELRFSWPAVIGATSYRVLESPDGGPTYTPVATDLTALSYNHTIPVHRRLNASYKIDACNAGGCVSSATLSVGAGLTQAIGYMKASNTQAGDQFGASVAVSGDGNTLAIGASREDSDSNGVNSTADELAPDAGAVYVFAKVAGSWSQQAYVKASNSAADNVFGQSVALSSDGNVLAVGAWGQEGQSGAAYVFIRSGGNWSEQAFLKASNPETLDLFGWSLALSADGNTLAVGAPGESSALTGVTAGSVSEGTAGNGMSMAGAVYVFGRSGAVWSQQAYVKASNTGSDFFGFALALSGDANTLAVGSPLESSAATNSGAVYVFAKVAGSWSQQAYVKASNTGAGDWFGNAVALSGDGNTLAVGAPFEDGSRLGVLAGAPNDATAGNTSIDSGAAYVLTRIGTAWSQQAYVKASNTGANDQFGSAVALSSDGNTLAAGAPFEASSGTGIGSASDEGTANAGAVYVYVRSGSAWSQQSFVKASNTGFGDNFGNALALSDNGDTLSVGALFESGSSTGIDGADNNSASQAGAAYLY